MDDKLEYEKFILQQPYVNDVRQEIKNKKAIKKKAEEELTLEKELKKQEKKKAESEGEETESEDKGKEREEKSELPAHKKNLLDLGIIDIHPNLEKYKKQPSKYSVIPKSAVDPNATFENINNLTDITRMISEKNNTFVLRSYVRILEYDVLFYYLLYNIIAINSLTKIDLKLLNRKLSNNHGPPDEKQKQLISNLEKRFNKLKNNIARQLKKYEINENFNGSNFYNFVQILERDKLYIFKQYCIGHNRKTRKEINSLKYNDYEDIGKFICMKSVGDIDKQFELSILDKYNLKYDTYKHHQSKEYSYYQTIAQPLVFHIDKENGDYNIKTILTNIRDEDENIQKKIDKTHDNAPSTKICFGKGFSGEPSKEYKGFYNDTKRFLNQPENASVKYNMEIQNPKLTKKTPLNYSRGVDTYLHNKIEKDKYFTKFVLDKQQFSSGDGGKTRNLMEQIKDNIKIIKKFKHLILKKLYQYKELHPHLTEDLSNEDLKPIQIMANEYLEKIIPDNIIESLIIEKRPYKYELNKVIKPYAIFESRLDTSSEVESLWSRREPVSKAIFKCPRINCPLADKEFTSLQALFLHTRAYHSGNMWVCPRISNGNPSGKEFKTLQDLREHDIKCHPIDKEPDESCFDDEPEEHGQSEKKVEEAADESKDDDDDDEGEEEEDDDGDECENYGKLKWFRNSCYMDSPIYLLFTRMLQFPEAALSKHLMEYKFEMDDLNSKRCFTKSDTGQFTPLDKSDSMPILKEIFIEFKKVFTNFSRGTAGDLNELRRLLSNCGGILTEKWDSPDTQDSDEFLFDLLEILQVKIPKQINGQISSSRTNKSKFYHFSDKNPYTASVIKFADDHGYTNLPKFTFKDGDGIAKYDAIVEKPAEYDNQVQQFIISGNHLQHLFRFGTELNALKLSPLNSAEIADEYKYYNEMIGLSFKTDDREEVDEIIKTRELSIMDMMRITEITNFKELGAEPTYHFHDSKYTTNGDDTFYFQKDDTEDPPKRLSLENIEEEKHGFKKTLSVELTELDNNSSDIFITVGRIVGYYNQTKNVTVQLKLNFKISEFNSLFIDGTKYNLHGLVYWQGDDAGGGGHYMTVFNCKGIFFNFDDLNGRSITKIGSYEELLAYKGGAILTHSVIYHYIREE